MSKTNTGSRIQAKAGSKSVARKRCQGRTKGIIPRVRRQFNRAPMPIEVRVLPKAPVEQ